VTEERALLSVIGPTSRSGVRIENWRYTAAFSRGPGRPCHMAYLTPPGFRYEGRIGDRHVRYDGAQHSIRIVPAGADCSLQVHASCWDVLALCVEPDRYSAFALNAGLPTAEIDEDLMDGDATMLHLCRALASSSDEPGSSGALLWEAISQSILTHLVGRYARHRRPAPGSLGSAALSRTLGYINDNLDGDVSIEAMADIAGLSPFHFSRTFARATGHSPHRYVMLARVERAVALLRGSSLPLAEIAFQTGFADQSHMARHVRQHHGISPKALRLAGAQTLAPIRASDERTRVMVFGGRDLT
jgi:AraC family transcriptional regulator